jgi:SAM-dependent methyltransferase
MAARDPGDPRHIVAHGYDAIVDAYARWAERVSDPTRDRLVADLAARLPAGARVLDVGCGSGVPWTARLAQRFEVTGIDISPRQVEAARRNVPAGTFVVGDIATAALEPGAFDAVVSLYALGHLPTVEHEAVLRRLQQALRPGGRMLVSLPAAPHGGWTGAWVGGVRMYFASLGEERYRGILREQGWTVHEAVVGVAEEPEGRAAFLWVLASAPGPAARARASGSRPGP